MFLSVHELFKSYDTGVVTPVLTGADLTLDRGQVGVILGPSGSGKSTMMNVIGGVDRADSGEVTVDGQRIDQLDDDALVEYRRTRVGFVFQFYHLIPNLTAGENVEVVSHISADPLPTEEVLSAVGLADKRKRFPRELSGGEQQRVAIARALVKRPALLLCDEPTGALDLHTSQEVLSLLQQVNTDYQTTIAVITHNAAIADMAHRVFRMADGRVEQVDTQHEPVRAERISW